MCSYRTEGATSAKREAAEGGRKSYPPPPLRVSGSLRLRRGTNIRTSHDCENEGNEDLWQVNGKPYIYILHFLLFSLKGVQRPAAFAIVCFCFCEFRTVSYSGSCAE